MSNIGIRGVKVLFLFFAILILSTDMSKSESYEEYINETYGPQILAISNSCYDLLPKYNPEYNLTDADWINGSENFVSCHINSFDKEIDGLENIVLEGNAGINETYKLKSLKELFELLINVSEKTIEDMDSEKELKEARSRPHCYVDFLGTVVDKCQMDLKAAEGDARIWKIWARNATVKILEFDKTALARVEALMANLNKSKSSTDSLSVKSDATMAAPEMSDAFVGTAAGILVAVMAIAVYEIYRKINKKKMEKNNVVPQISYPNLADVSVQQN